MLLLRWWNWHFCDFEEISLRCKSDLSNNQTRAWAPASVLFLKKQELVTLRMTDWCLEGFGQNAAVRRGWDNMISRCVVHVKSLYSLPSLSKVTYRGRRVTYSNLKMISVYIGVSFLWLYFILVLHLSFVFFSFIKRSDIAKEQNTRRGQVIS